MILEKGIEGIDSIEIGIVDDILDGRNEYDLKASRSTEKEGLLYPHDDCIDKPQDNARGT